MMTLVFISLLAGLVLGQRLNVLVLVPAVVVALTLTVGVGIARADTVGAIVLMALVAAVSLQIGYFAGVCIRRGLVVTRATGLPEASPAARRHGIPLH